MVVQSLFHVVFKTSPEQPGPDPIAEHCLEHEVGLETPFEVMSSLGYPLILETVNMHVIFF